MSSAELCRSDRRLTVRMGIEGTCARVVLCFLVCASPVSATCVMLTGLAHGCVRSHGQCTAGCGFTGPCCVGENAFRRKRRGCTRAFKTYPFNVRRIPRSRAPRYIPRDRASTKRGTLVFTSGCRVACAAERCGRFEHSGEGHLTSLMALGYTSVTSETAHCAAPADSRWQGSAVPKGQFLARPNLTQGNQANHIVHIATYIT